MSFSAPNIPQPQGMAKKAFIAGRAVGKTTNVNTATASVTRELDSEHINLAHQLNSVGYHLNNILNNVDQIKYRAQTIGEHLTYQSHVSSHVDEVVESQLEEIRNTVVDFVDTATNFAVSVHSYSGELSKIINSDPDLLAAFATLPSQNKEISENVDESENEYPPPEIKKRSTSFISFLEEHFPILVFWRNPWNKNQKAWKETEMARRRQGKEKRKKEMLNKIAQMESENDF